MNLLGRRVLVVLTRFVLENLNVSADKFAFDNERQCCLPDEDVPLPFLDNQIQIHIAAFLHDRSLHPPN